MAKIDGQITQVFNVSESLLFDCYLIANISRPNNAIMIYGTMRDEINSKKHILFTYSYRDTLCGFIKGHLIADGAQRHGLIGCLWTKSIRVPVLVVG